MIRESELGGAKISEVKFSPMTHSDLDQVMEIERDSFPLPWTRQSYANEIVNPASIYIAGKHNDELVSYAGAWIIMGEAHITTIAVARRWQGKGLGRQAFAELARQTILAGANRITLEVRVSNDRAIRIYRKFSLKMVGRRRGYYSDNNEDAAIYWLNDVNDPGFVAAMDTCLGPGWRERR